MTLAKELYEKAYDVLTYYERKIPAEYAVGKRALLRALEMNSLEVEDAFVANMRELLRDHDSPNTDEEDTAFILAVGIRMAEDKTYELGDSGRPTRDVGRAGRRQVERGGDFRRSTSRRSEGSMGSALFDDIHSDGGREPRRATRQQPQSQPEPVLREAPRSPNVWVYTREMPYLPVTRFGTAPDISSEGGKFNLEGTKEMDRAAHATAHTSPHQITSYQMHTASTRVVSKALRDPISLADIPEGQPHLKVSKTDMVAVSFGSQITTAICMETPVQQGSAIIFRHHVRQPFHALRSMPGSAGILKTLAETNTFGLLVRKLGELLRLAGSSGEFDTDIKVAWLMAVERRIRRDVLKILRLGTGRPSLSLDNIVEDYHDMLDYMGKTFGGAAVTALSDELSEYHRHFVAAITATTDQATNVGDKNVAVNEEGYVPVTVTTLVIRGSSATYNLDGMGYRSSRAVMPSITPELYMAIDRAFAESAMVVRLAFFDNEVELYDVARPLLNTGDVIVVSPYDETPERLITEKPVTL